MSEDGHTNQLHKALARNLREYRARLGLSQERLADQLGYHRTYVGGLERGERNLTLASLEHLGTLLDVHPLDLLRI